jgi:prevent-host-death family protein
MARSELQISASEFKATCLELLDRIAARKITRLVVTKRGRPVAVLTPPESPRAAAEGLFGALAGSVVAPSGFDFAAPVLDEELFAAGGRVHE